MKLCIVTDAWNQINGVVTTLTNLKREAELDGWEVLVIHPEMFYNIEFPLYRGIRLSFPFNLRKKIDSFNPDHLHIATEGPLGIAARISFRREQYTTAYHTQWAPFLKDIMRIPESFTWGFIRWFHQHGKVMVPTITIKNELLEKKIASEIVLFSRGVNLELLSPSTEYTKTKKPRLLSVGRISKEKNLETFCELDPTKYDLIVVGDGPYLETLKKQYPHVNFLGSKFGTDLANEYVISDVLVFTSKKDTFGLVMIEAQCLGTPVAAFPVTGPIDVLFPETGAMSFDIETAIDAALALDRDICREKARKEFSWKSVWQQFRTNLVSHT